jgi:hypothetical protein
MRPATAVAGVALIAGAVAAVVVSRTPSRPARPVPAGEGDVASPDGGSDETARAAPAPPSNQPVPGQAAARRDAAAAVSEPGESELMATLRAIGGTAPLRSIELARDGQRRFPNSADAPERAFIVVQSLVNLRRFHEAQDEARAMIRKYPDNPFALDAQRHLLVYPLDQPSREEMQQQRDH